ncbi:hypothetical protein, partial [Polaromonas sp.]|uniref:hypothetical protein n=1 Tax=Polaromonas sp. TaxID=1869339 RepID=UPI0027339610
LCFILSLPFCHVKNVQVQRLGPPRHVRVAGGCIAAVHDRAFAGSVQIFRVHINLRSWHRQLKFAKVKRSGCEEPVVPYCLKKIQTLRATFLIEKSVYLPGVVINVIFNNHPDSPELGSPYGERQMSMRAKVPARTDKGPPASAGEVLPRALQGGVSLIMNCLGQVKP